MVIVTGMFLTSVMPHLKLTDLHLELDRCFIAQMVGLVLIAIGAVAGKHE